MKRLGEAIPLSRLRRLRRTELPVDTVELARYLIGKIVVHDTDDGRLSGRIVETEAYPVGDSAGHAFRGETRRNASLFLGRGHAYVYFTYGSSFMLNVTSEAVGVGAGVLLRALEPLEGIDRMQRARGGAELLDLARGPGRLAEAMLIDFKQDGLDLCAAGPLWLAATRSKTGAIGESVRIGLTRNVDQNALLRARQSIREWSKEVTRVVAWHSQINLDIAADGLEQQISKLPVAGGSSGSGSYWTLPPINPHSQVWQTPVRHDHCTGTSQASANSSKLENREFHGTVSPLRVNETCGPMPGSPAGA